MDTIPNITSLTKVKEIHEFYNQLSRTARAISTMKKLQSAQSHVYSIMDKLGPVAKALIHKYDEWEEWGLEELVESLRTLTEILYLKRLPGTMMSRNLWDRIRKSVGKK